LEMKVQKIIFNLKYGALPEMAVMPSKIFWKCRFLLAF